MMKIGGDQPDHQNPDMDMGTINETFADLLNLIYEFLHRVIVKQ